MLEKVPQKKKLLRVLKKIYEIFLNLLIFVKINSIKSEVKNLFPDQRVQPDLIVEVKTKDKKKYFIVIEVKSAGQPRFTRMAVSQLKYMVRIREIIMVYLPQPLFQKSLNKFAMKIILVL